MTMEKILITGGAGFVGLAMARRLLDEGHQVDLLDNMARGQADQDLLALLAKPRARLIEADLTDPRAFLGLDKDYDLIFHLAAVIGVRNVMNHPDKVLYVNAISNLNLFEFAKGMPRLRRLVFSSTSEIYAGTLHHHGLPLPTPEDVPLALLDIQSPRTTYMLSKMYGESICFNYGRTHGIPFTILRFHNVYGPRMGFQHVVPEMFLKIARDSRVEVASPTHTRAMCYIDDAVDMSLRAARAQEAQGQVLNVGNPDQEVSILRLVETVAKVLGRDIETVPMPDTPGSPARRCPDISRIVALTGFRPRVDLEQGIRLTYDWYKHRLDKPHE